jgi:ribosomal protein S18 acetylase RimI-like enzyme
MSSGTPAGGAEGKRERRTRVVELSDERDPRTLEALDLVAESFAPQDRQSVSSLRYEIEEKRRGLLFPGNIHVLAAIAPAGHVAGTVVGIYLDTVNAGLITYLAVRPEHRRQQLARRLRTRLVRSFGDDARANRHEDVAWVIGEVRSDNAWLRRLIRQRGAIVFDFEYYHPGMAPGRGSARYVLYRQPAGDGRRTLPAALVARIVYAVYRRGYRVRYPLEHDGFVAMIAALEGRDEIPPHPEFLPPD